jgi:DNA-binding Lrp family transcriptional regulator
MGPLLVKWTSVQLLICDPDVLTSAKVLAIRLYQYQNAVTGACFPGVNRLARDIGLSSRTVRKLLRHLEERGWVRTEISKGPRGANFYNLPYAGRKFGAGGAEILVPKGRNPTSVKIGNEIEKEKKKQNRSFSSARYGADGNKSGTGRFAKKRGELEAAVVARLGDKGWELLMEIGEYTLDAATSRLMAGQPLNDVITDLLNDR